MIQSIDLIWMSPVLCVLVCVCVCVCVLLDNFNTCVSSCTHLYSHLHKDFSCRFFFFFITTPTCLLASLTPGQPPFLKFIISKMLYKWNHTVLTFGDWFFPHSRIPWRLIHFVSFGGVFYSLLYPQHLEHCQAGSGSQ